MKFAPRGGVFPVSNVLGYFGTDVGDLPLAIYSREYCEENMLNQSESALARVSRQLAQLEKRDWKGWVVLSLTGILVSTGLPAILLPAAFRGDTIHFEITVSRPLAIGLFVLLALANTYCDEVF
jgi:hypothetical protein